MVNGIRICIALIAAGALLVCTRDYNPFADRSLALAVTSGSFADGDTVEMFCRETLDVAIAAAELVDSVVIKADANRFWDGDTAIVVGEKAAAPIRRIFEVSLYDTGWQNIYVMTYRRGGDIAERRIRVYSTFMLRQADVTGCFDESVLLDAGGVKDQDVVYLWDFGRGNIIESATAQKTAVIHDAGFDGAGYAWVVDVQGRHASPKAVFSYSFVDTLGPRIECVNEGFVGRDTIRTGAETFFLRVRITDRGRSVDTATADGGAFDLVEGAEYVKIIHNVNRIAAVYLPVKIWARDREPQPNESEKTLYVYYDASLPALGQGVRLSVLVPARDTVTTGVKEHYILGSLQNYTGGQIVIAAAVNREETGRRDTLGVQYNSQWGTPVTLTRGTNSIVIRALSLSGAVMDTVLLTMIYDTSLVDTAAPVLVSLTIGGEPADGARVRPDSAVMRIVAFDEGSGVSLLRVNGTARPASDTTGIWHVTVALEHVMEGNAIEVVAVDGRGLQTDTTVRVFQNNAPIIQKRLSPPYPLVVGAVYRDTLMAQDDDEDVVFFEKAVGPPALSVSAAGEVYWCPQMSDTGRYELVVRYRDGMESGLFVCSLTVVDSAYYRNTVAFSITERDFPSYVEAGDTMKVVLAVRPGAGTPPFTFTALRRVGAHYEELSVYGNELIWVTTAADTGYQRLVIRVEDRLRRSDTLYPSILVVPPNRDFGVSVEHGLDTLSDGTLDMRKREGPETLVVRLDDPDTTAVEQYRVVVSRRGMEDIRTVSGTDRFLVVLDPAAAPPGRDTMTVRITDRGGHTHTMTLAVLYRGVKVIINTKPSGAGLTEAVLDFPLLVRLTRGNFARFSDIAAGGSAVWFAKADGTVLGHEVERWDAAAGAAEVWVRMDTVKANDSTQYIEMYWGGTPPAASRGSVFDTAAGYEAVWHLGASLNDATPHGYDGVNYGTTLAPGCIGYGRAFDGTSSHISAARLKPVLASAHAATLSGWVYAAATAEMNVVCAAIGNSGTITPLSRASLSINQPDVGDVTLLGRTADTEEAPQQFNGNFNLVTQNTWHHCVGILDYRLDSMFIYVDGELRAKGQVDFSAPTPATLSEMTEIGAQDDANGFFFAGTLDEVRISRVRRSASWIKLSYKNQMPASTVVRFQ